MIFATIRRSLGLKIIFASALVQVLVLGILLFNSVRLLNNTVEDYLQFELSQVPPLLNTALAPMVFERDFASIESFLNDMDLDSRGGLTYLAVYDDSEQVYGMRGPFLDGGFADPPENRMNGASSQTIHAVIPLELAGESVGQVRFGISLEHLNQARKTLLTRGLLISGLGIILTIAVLGTLGSLLTRKLSLLVSQARAMSDGDYSASIKISGRDEVGQLAESFNSLASAVRENITSLQESEQRFRTIFEQAAVGVALIDSRTGHFLRINQRYCEMVGYTIAEMTALKTFQEITHPDDLEADLNYMARLLAGQIREFTMEKRYLHKNGNVVWVNLSVSPTWGIDEEPSAHIAVVENITERKGREDEKERLQRELLQAHKMEALGQLTGGIAHDFNNILGIITGYSELALKECIKKGERKPAEQLETVINSAERAKNLVSQMLDFSRSKASDSKPMLLLSLIEDELKMLRPTLPTSIEIKAELEKDLPMVLMNSIQLNQMLMNLCVNARDAMDGHGTLSIRLGWLTGLNTECSACHEKVTGDWVGLSVADTGSGIESDELNRIFDPFHTTKEVGKGTGMGLSVVQRIMHNLNGHILVETKQHEGSTVRLIFPPVFQVDSIASPEENSSSSHSLQGNGERILIVDDEVDLAKVFGSFLDAQGYEATVLSDSQEALVQIKENPDGFSMLVTDQTMPGLTGNKLIAEARGVRPDLPALLITGYSDEIDEKTAVALGIGYLQKPVTRDRLVQTVGDLLQSDS